MTKLSGLEAMRLHRDQREAPLRQEIEELKEQRDQALWRENILRRNLAVIQNALSYKIMDHVTAGMSAELSQRLLREIEDAVLKHGPKHEFQDVYFHLSPAVMTSLDPASLVQRIQQQYPVKALPKVSFSEVLQEKPTRHGVRYRITIPSLSYDQVIWEL